MSLDEGQEGFCHRPTAGISKTEGIANRRDTNAGER